MTDVQLFGFSGSTYVRSVMMGCAALDVTWELLPLEFGKPSHIALHPFGKMPVLRHGEVHLYETAAILSYVNDLADGALIPETPVDRARMWQLVSICIDYAYLALVQATFAEDKESIDAEAANRCMDAVVAIMGSDPWLAGSRLSFADLVFEPMLSHYLKSAPNAPAQLEQRPALARWHGAMQEHPATIAAYNESQAA